MAGFAGSRSVLGLNKLGIDGAKSTVERAWLSGKRAIRPWRSGFAITWNEVARGPGGVHDYDTLLHARVGAGGYVSHPRTSSVP
jgi:hypothetical protein